LRAGTVNGIPAAGRNRIVPKSYMAICVGASLGAVKRWAPGTELGGLRPELPPRTLAANQTAATGES
jgi:fluoride ion exporter CrcB/FEX